MMPRMPSPIRTGRTSPIRDGSVSPVSFRATTPTANDFPTPQGKIFTVRKRDKGLVSPAQSAFSFPDDDSPIHAISTPPTPPDSLDPDQRAMTRPLDRGTPGEPISTVIGSSEQRTLRKRRSHQFYQEVFACREPNISNKDRIHKDSIVTCEIKTNVIVKDEYELLQDVSHHLSLRYQRPLTSIGVTLAHSACMLFGGTFDSAYILTIHALPSQLQPTTNKRNAALHQAFMADALGVAPIRGVVKFMGIPDEDLAFNGTTVLGQIENLQTASDSARHSKQSSVAGMAPFAPSPVLSSVTNPSSYAPPPPNSAPHLASQPPSDPPSYPAPTLAPAPPPTLAPAPSTRRKRQDSQRDPNRYRFTPKKLPLREGSQSLPLSRAPSPSLDGRPSFSQDPFRSPQMSAIPMPAEPGKSALDWRAERMRNQSRGGKLGKRRSFWGVFGKRGQDGVRGGRGEVVRTGDG